VDNHDRYRGALLGLAAGDALGTTLEFKPPGTFEPITDIVGDGPCGLQPGQWTDDTSMALCLAESLVTCQGFDAADQMRRYVRWYREGYWSSTGTLFDIGSTVSAALRRFERDGNPFACETHARAGGNGSLMRLVAIPLAFANDPTEALRLAGEMSRTTHAAPEPVDACRYYAGLVLGALRGERKERLLAPRYSPESGVWEGEALCPRIDVSVLPFHLPAPRLLARIVSTLNEVDTWTLRHAR